MNEITKPLTKFLPVEVPEDNPFQYDALGRKEICEKLTLLIRTSTTPFVLAVDTEWGNGKTTFLKMWQAYLTKRKFKTVFFDAWSHDFYDEALPALIGKIEEQIETGEDFETKAKDLVRAIPSAAIKQVLSIVGVEKMATALEEALQKHDKIQDYLNYREAVEEFKEALRDVADKQTQKPLVIFIDELDRCRPTFALEVLEKVKHIFAVENIFIFFVIAVNKKEFAKTIESEYGNIDGYAYLQKFFDTTTVLKNDNEKFTEMLIQKLRINTAPEPPPGSEPQKPRYIHPFSTPCNEHQIFSTLCNAFNISLRVQEQIISLLSIVSGALKEKPPFIGINEYPVKIDNGGLCLFFFLTILKVTDPSRFRKMADSLNIRNRDHFPDNESRSFINDKLNMLQYGSAENEKFSGFIRGFINRFFSTLDRGEGQSSEWSHCREEYNAFYISEKFIAQVVKPGGARKILAALLDIIDLVE